MALKLDFPDVALKMSDEAGAELAAGRSSEALSKLQGQMLMFVQTSRSRLIEAPQSALGNMASATAALFIAVKAESPDVCGGLAAGVSPPKWNTEAEQEAAEKLMVALVHAAKAAKDAPTDRSVPNKTDVAEFGERLRAVGITPEEVTLLANPAMAATPRAVRCDLEIHKLQAAVSLTPAAASRMLPPVLRLGSAKAQAPSSAVR
jgi:hypothetical protein